MKGMGDWRVLHLREGPPVSERAARAGAASSDRSAASRCRQVKLQSLKQSGWRSSLRQSPEKSDAAKVSARAVRARQRKNFAFGKNFDIFDTDEQGRRFETTRQHYADWSGQPPPLQRQLSRRLNEESQQAPQRRVLKESTLREGASSPKGCKLKGPKFATAEPPQPVKLGKRFGYNAHPMGLNPNPKRAGDPTRKPQPWSDATVDTGEPQFCRAYMGRVKGPPDGREYQFKPRIKLPAHELSLMAESDDLVHILNPDAKPAQPARKKSSQFIHREHRHRKASGAYGQANQETAQDCRENPTNAHRSARRVRRSSVAKPTTTAHRALQPEAATPVARASPPKQKRSQIDKVLAGEWGPEGCGYEKSLHARQIERLQKKYKLDLALAHRRQRDAKRLYNKIRKRR